jgi:SAM-dependent methyltransferase
MKWLKNLLRSGSRTPAPSSCVAKASSVPLNSDVYYHGIYWNDYEAIVKYINSRVSGDPATPWYVHFKRLVRGHVFRKALIINCGNGWVERLLFDAGLFSEGLGIDISQELLIRAAADAAGRPLRYEKRDINIADFVEDGFDLVINHAAAHHVQFIDRVFRKIALALPEDGYFLNYDYVGPHRNQYSARNWTELLRVNRSLPADAQAHLDLPDLTTMSHLIRLRRSIPN